MEKEKLIQIINKYFEGKVLKYDGVLIPGVDMNADIDFKVQVMGIRKMISVGEWYDHFSLKITIVGLNNEISKLFFGFIPDLKFYSKSLSEKDFWFFKSNLIAYLRGIIRFFDNEDVYLVIDKLDVDIDKKPITESRMSSVAVRTMVRDIVELIKKNPPTRRVYHLPNKKESYKFTNLPFEIGLELTLIPSKKVKGFLTTTYYVADYDLIQLGIKYNPDTLLQNLYDLIGELNEIIAHELEHGYQEYYGEYMSDEDFEEIDDPFTYYTLPHEIPAQIKGFKRLSKIRKQPFEVVVKNWFDTHKDIHGLNPKETEEVIKIILKNYYDKRGN